MGSTPFLGGGFGHFYAYAPAKIEYAIDRYAMEVKRQLDVLDRRLAQSPYLVGDDYTIADMAAWPWYGALVKGLIYEAGEFLQVQAYTHVLRWTNQIARRPAVRRGRMANRALPGQMNYPKIPELAQRGLARLQQFLIMLNERLAERNFIATERFSVADITAVVALDFARVVKVRANAQHPHLVRWREAMARRPSMS